MDIVTQEDRFTKPEEFCEHPNGMFTKLPIEIIHQLCIFSYRESKITLHALFWSCKTLHNHIGEKLMYFLSPMVEPDITETFALAAEGSLEMLKWVHYAFGDTIFCPGLCAEAAKYGQIKVLKWLRSPGLPGSPKGVCEWCTYTMVNAASKGYLDVLKWARENGCPWREFVCECAALNGHLQVLKWLRANDCPWNSDTCTGAALNGHLETLKWAHNDGCSWDRDTTIFAAQNGQLETLKWAVEHGCPMDLSICVARAKMTGQTHVVALLELNQN